MNRFLIFRFCFFFKWGFFVVFFWSVFRVEIICLVLFVNWKRTFEPTKWWMIYVWLLLLFRLAFLCYSSVQRNWTFTFSSALPAHSRMWWSTNDGKRASSFIGLFDFLNVHKKNSSHSPKINDPVYIHQHTHNVRMQKEDRSSALTHTPLRKSYLYFS